MWEKFWAWYERTYALNVGVALGLFLLQILHLFWLTGDVVWPRLFGEALLHVHGTSELLIALVDYTEIPALLSVSLVYLNELRKGYSGKNLMYLLFLNTQWIHLFWITDEFVVTSFNGEGTVLPLWLAWVAIGIDYLELPVMFDTIRRFIGVIAKNMPTPTRSETMSERASPTDGE